MQQRMQQSYVTPREYHEVDLSSAKSKLPDFSGSRSEGDHRKFEDIRKPEAEPEMLLQPDIRPLSHEQLVSEVKGIYAGLVMVEAKCIAENEKYIDINESQSPTAQGKSTSKSIHPKDDQWQSLVALHKQLLHEHHDFFLASQHPSASPALSRLATKYARPARMWRHGIYAFLEVLRHRLPESLEHMLAFIYIAYSMMTLLYETIPTFEETWTECLGDLGRYRMAIEDDGAKDKEIWKNVARFWYNKAADKSPNVGRLYHHLTILARPFTLEQLSLYTRSLTCVFNPITNRKESATRRSSLFETTFIRAHRILFTKGHANPSDQFDEAIKELEVGGLSDNYIIKASTRFKEIGVFAAIANIAALFEYGKAKWRIPTPINTEQPDPAFPKPAGDLNGRPLPEDFVMRGSLSSQWTWFTDTTVGDDNLSSEVPSVSQPWMDRLLWLGRPIPSVCLPLPIRIILLIDC